MPSLSEAKDAVAANAVAALSEEGVFWPLSPFSAAPPPCSTEAPTPAWTPLTCPRFPGERHGHRAHLRLRYNERHGARNGLALGSMGRARGSLLSTHQLPLAFIKYLLSSVIGHDRIMTELYADPHGPAHQTEEVFRRVNPSSAVGGSFAARRLRAISRRGVFLRLLKSRPRAYSGHPLKTAAVSGLRAPRAVAGPADARGRRPWARFWARLAAPWARQGTWDCVGFLQRARRETRPRREEVRTNPNGAPRACRSAHLFGR